MTNSWKQRKKSLPKPPSLKRGGIAAALLLTLAGLAAAPLAAPKGDGPREALIILAGETCRTIPLDENAPPETFTIETAAGRNEIILRGGTVAVSAADCPNRLCQRQGAISQPGETIACLPHRLLITIREAP